MPGRKAIPTHLKVLMGNPGKQKLPQGEPEPEIRIPDPPAVFGRYALEEWQRVTPVLFSLGIISDLTVPAVIAYCDAYSYWRIATEQLNKLKDGDHPLSALIHKTEDGNIVPNPLMVVAERHRRDMIRFAAEFGGTEVAKVRLAVNPRGKASKFKGLIGKQQEG